MHILHIKRIFTFILSAIRQTLHLGCLDAMILAIIEYIVNTHTHAHVHSTFWYHFFTGHFCLEKSSEKCSIMRLDKFHVTVSIDVCITVSSALLPIPTPPPDVFCVRGNPGIAILPVVCTDVGPVNSQWALGPMSVASGLCELAKLFPILSSLSVRPKG